MKNHRQGAPVGSARPARPAERSSDIDPEHFDRLSVDRLHLNGNNSDTMPTKRKTKRPTLTDKLREAIADSGLSFQELQRQTGVVRQSLMKFARGEQSLRLDFADKLAEFFSLELVERDKGE